MTKSMFCLDLTGLSLCLILNAVKKDKIRVNMAKNEAALDPEIERLSEKYSKDPNSLVFAYLADAYRRSNLIDEAIDIVKRGLQIHPHYSSAHIVLGCCFRDKRMY